MSFFDEARAISAIIDMRRMTQHELARSMGVSQSFIANKIRLLKFSSSIEHRIIETGLSERHARALLRLKTEKEIYTAIDKISAMGLNVRQSEVLIDSMIPKKELEIDYAIVDEKDIRAELEKSISSALAVLRRLGRCATSTVSFYDNKRYITICIDE